MPHPSRGYKGSVSCPPALCGATRSATAELAPTSKIPRRGSAPLAPRCNKVCPAQYHNKLRPEHVEDGVLNGSTRGEASRRTQSRDILKSEDKTKHLCSKTNTEQITDSERPSAAEALDDFLGGATTVPCLSTVDMPSSESQVEEADDEVLDSWQDTYENVSQSRSAPAVLCHSPFSLESPTAQPSTSAFSHEAPVNADGYSLRFRFSSQLTHHQSSWRTSQTGLVPSPTTSSRQQGAAAQIGTSTTRTQLSATEACGPSTSAQLDNLNLDDTRHCEGAEGGATAAENTAESSQQIACRRTERSLVGLSHEEEEDQCRICHGTDSLPTNPLVSSCLCSGSLRFTHLECLKTWIQTKLESGSALCIVKRCEICMAGLTLDIDLFDLDRYCRRHRWDQMDFTQTINYVVAIAEVEALRTLHFRVLLQALMTFHSQDLGVQVRPAHDALPGTLRRIREHRSPSEESPESTESTQSTESAEPLDDT